VTPGSNCCLPVSDYIAAASSQYTGNCHPPPLNFFLLGKFYSTFATDFDNFKTIVGKFRGKIEIMSTYSLLCWKFAAVGKLNFLPHPLLFKPTTPLVTTIPCDTPAVVTAIMMITKDNSQTCSSKLTPSQFNLCPVPYTTVGQWTLGRVGSGSVGSGPVQSFSLGSESGWI